MNGILQGIHVLFVTSLMDVISFQDFNLENIVQLFVMLTFFCDVLLHCIRYLCMCS